MGNLSSAIGGGGFSGTSTQTEVIIPDKFRKQLEVAWKNTLGHMYGKNFQDEVHKAIGKPNLPGMGKYETGKKKGQPRKIRFRKSRPNGKAIISRVPDSNAFGFRYMYGARLPIWEVQGNFTVEMGFKAKGSTDNPTVNQESGYTSIMHVMRKGSLPKFYNRRNVKKSVREDFKREWESLPKEYSSFYMSRGFKEYFRDKWGYEYKPSIKSTKHPTLGIAFSRQEKKFAKTMAKYIKENLQRITNVSVKKV